MNKISRIRRIGMACGAGSLLVVMLAGATFAADSVQSITAGAKTASMADLALPSVAYNNADRAVAGSMTLTVDDSTDSSLGWGVTVQVSDFAYSGSAIGGTAIPADNFAITAAGVPVTIAGHASSNTAATGPQVATTFVAGSLATPRRTIEATAGYGQGTYTQALAVSLTIPGMSHVGTYTGTLTETFVAAP